MPTILVYDDDVVNAVQPEVSAVKIGVATSNLVDANLSQYTSTAAPLHSCCDVNGLTLWTLDDGDIEQLFLDAGSDTPTSFQECSVWLNQAGDKVIFYMIGTFSSDRYLYLGVADISAVGAVAAPVLIDYVRMLLPGINLYEAVGLWEYRSGATPGSILIMTRDFTGDKIRWHVCPPVAAIEAGTYKGAHPFVTVGVLSPDQGPGISGSWTSSTALHIGRMAGFQDGTVRDNPIGFCVNNTFYFLVPRGWMEDGTNGFSIDWGATRPNGGLFQVDIGVGGIEYGDYHFGFEEVLASLSTSDDAVDVSETLFTPGLPWTEEYSRLFDGADDDGFLTSYCGRPAIFYALDGNPVLLFGIIDGNATYADDVGEGDRIFYAKVRGYKWTGSAFAQFDDAEGIILRQGDLGYSSYNFSAPASQYIYQFDGDIYFQICQPGSTSTSRSVLTRFGRFEETPTRTPTAYGRHRYVPRV
jgi:hypothetical protein